MSLSSSGSVIGDVYCHRKPVRLLPCVFCSFLRYAMKHWEVSTELLSHIYFEENTAFFSSCYIFITWREDFIVMEASASVVDLEEKPHLSRRSLRSLTDRRVTLRKFCLPSWHAIPVVVVVVVAIITIGSQHFPKFSRPHTSETRKKLLLPHNNMNILYT